MVDSETTDEDAAELQTLRMLLATMPSAAPPLERRSLPTVPFEPLPPLPVEAKLAIEAAALEANDRYLETFLEPHSFCPFSRAGRARGQTLRFVHYAESCDLTPFFDRMADAARDPSRVVIQVIAPLIEASPSAWSQFCHELTAAGNERLRHGPGGGSDLFAVAPLHPELPYSAHDAYALIPLFRRTPDPTIQWVRLDALESLYRGRTGDTVYADPDHLDAVFAQPRRRPLFERIAETNQKMAQRLGVSAVERSLRSISHAARAQYATILLGGARPAPHTCLPSDQHCVPKTDASPPRPALLRRDGHVALVRVEELVPRAPTRFVADDVELVAVRTDEVVHVLHGRCPHRNAPLSDAVVDEDRLVCLHHGWDFELASGRSQGVPGAAVARFRAWVSEGLLWVDAGELRAWRDGHVPVFDDGDDVL